MRKRLAITGLALAGALAGCATGPTRFPVQATRFHYDPVADRGTIAVEPLDAGGPASIEFKTYAAAVESELLRLGFTPVAPGAIPQFRATVGFTRTSRPLPPRRSPLSIGIGGGGFSGGGYRGGGVGLGGGVSFPVGGNRARTGVITELSVRIRRGPDAVWEGHAQTLTDLSAQTADANAEGARLAHALFLGFPGDSGRTIEVK